MSAKVRKHRGAWWVFSEYKGLRQSKRCKNQKAANALASAILLRQGAAKFGLPTASSKQTFASYADDWLKLGEKSRKPTTHRFYEFNLRLHVLPVLGPKLLGTISRADCRAVLAEAQKKTLRRNSLHGIQRTLSAVLSGAVEDGVLQANPAFRLGRHLRQTDEPRVMTPWTREDAKTFLDSVQASCPDYHVLFLTALRTGLRLGELLGLRVGDLDLKARALEVRRSLVNGRVTTPKSGKSRRVDVSNGLVAALEAHVKDREAEDYVFQAPEGGLLDGCNLRRRVFVPAVKAAKVRMIRIHDLRHTFASLLIQNGESLAYVRDQLGHSSIQITVDVYGKLIPGSNRAAVDKLDD